MLAATIKRFKKEEKGFTLIELLAVIVILGIIAAIAIPLIGNIINKSRADSDAATARQIYDATRIYVTSELNADFKNSNKTSGNLIVDVTTLQTKGYLEDNLVLPSSKSKINGGSIEFSRTTGDIIYVSYTTVADPVQKYFTGADVLAGNGTATTTKPSTT